MIKIGLMVVIPILAVMCFAQVSFNGRLAISGNVSVQNPTNEHGIWMVASDVHVGRPNTFADGEPSNNFAHGILSQGATLVFATGDIADQSGYTQSQYMVTVTNAFPNVTWLVTAGNHDACSDCGGDGVPFQTCDAGTAICDETYSNFISVVNGGSTNLHWVRDWGGFRFIGFNSEQIRSGVNQGFGKVEDWEYTWVTNEIQNAKVLGKHTIMCTHYPLVNDWGNNIKQHQTELLEQVASSNGVVAWFAGHRHMWGDHVTNNGVVHVNIPGLSYSQNATDPPYSILGGYFMVTVTNRQLQFQLWCANDPTYTMRDTNFFIPY